MPSIKRMIQRHPIAVMTVFSLTMFCVVSMICLWAAGTEGEKSNAATAGKVALLAVRHGAAGVDCSGCHKESPPNIAPARKVCLECHGPYEKLAARGEK